MPFRGRTYYIGGTGDYLAFRALTTAQLATITAIDIAAGVTLDELALDNLPALTALTLGEGVLIDSFLLGAYVPFLPIFGDPIWCGRYFNNWTIRGQRYMNPHPHSFSMYHDSHGGKPGGSGGIHPHSSGIPNSRTGSFGHFNSGGHMGGFGGHGGGGHR